MTQFRLQRYNIFAKYANFSALFCVFLHKICTCQKKTLPLQSVLQKDYDKLFTTIFIPRAICVVYLFVAGVHSDVHHVVVYQSS